MSRRRKATPTHAQRCIQSTTCHKSPATHPRSPPGHRPVDVAAPAQATQLRPLCEARRCEEPRPPPVSCGIAPQPTRGGRSPSGTNRGPHTIHSSERLQNSVEKPTYLRRVHLNRAHHLQQQLQLLQEVGRHLMLGQHWQNPSWKPAHRNTLLAVFTAPLALDAGSRQDAAATTSIAKLLGAAQTGHLIRLHRLAD